MKFCSVRRKYQNLMRKALLLLLFTFCCYYGYGQNQQALTDFNAKRTNITQVGMITLGSWALGNVAVNGLLLNQAEGDRYYFCQMNMLWGGINAVVAGLGYYGAIRSSTTLDLTHTINEYQGISRTLLFNAGLDVAYVVGGLYLLERAKNETKRMDRFRGYGRAVMLQGGFLLAFDAVLYFVLRSQSEALDTIIQNLTVSSQGMGFIYRF